MSDLAGFRKMLRRTLAGDADRSDVWTSDLLDEALRLALDEYANWLVLETSFTVTTAGYSQDLSSVTDLLSVQGVAWPWTDGDDYAARMVMWRWVSEDTIYIEDGEPAVNDVIRLRYTRQQLIQNLDSAASTTIPTEQERVVVLLAAAEASGLRADELSRSFSVNPIELSRMTERVDEWRDRAESMAGRVNVSAMPVWDKVGL